jgi:hypothetical protein
LRCHITTSTRLVPVGSITAIIRAVVAADRRFRTAAVNPVRLQTSVTDARDR